MILVSGIFGVALQNYIPRRMTELVTRETIYEQIPTVVRGLRIEADERVEFITADLGLEDGSVGTGARRRREAVFRSGAEEERRRKGAGGRREAQERRRRSRWTRTPARRCARITCRRSGRYLTDTPAALLPQAASARAQVSPPISVTCAPSCRWRRTTFCATWRRSAKSAASLLVQRRLHLWLHGWLLVHVPLSFAFLVLTAVHAVLSLRY